MHVSRISIELLTPTVLPTCLPFNSHNIKPTKVPYSLPNVIIANFYFLRVHVDAGEKKEKKWEATDFLNNDGGKKEKNVSRTNKLTMRWSVYWYTLEEPEAHSMEESVSNLLASKLPPDLTWPNLMWL